MTKLDLSSLKLILSRDEGMPGGGLALNIMKKQELKGEATIWNPSPFPMIFRQEHGSMTKELWFHAIAVLYRQLFTLASTCTFSFVPPKENGFSMVLNMFHLSQDSFKEEFGEKKQDVCI